MNKKELAKMKRRVTTLQRQLGALGPVMRGSVVVIGTRNKQPYFVEQRQEDEADLLGEEEARTRQGILRQRKRPPVP